MIDKHTTHPSNEKPAKNLTGIKNIVARECGGSYLGKLKCLLLQLEIGYGLMGLMSRQQCSCRVTLRVQAKVKRLKENFALMLKHRYLIS